MRVELRDASGRLLGWKQESGGRVEGRDASGILRGWYDRARNETRQADGRLSAYGDLLAALIVERG